MTSSDAEDTAPSSGRGSDRALTRAIGELSRELRALHVRSDDDDLPIQGAIESLDEELYRLRVDGALPLHAAIAQLSTDIGVARREMRVLTFTCAVLDFLGVIGIALYLTQLMLGR